MATGRRHVRAEEPKPQRHLPRRRWRIAPAGCLLPGAGPFGPGTRRSDPGGGAARTPPVSAGHLCPAVRPGAAVDVTGGPRMIRLATHPRGETQPMRRRALLPLAAVLAAPA